MSACLFVCLSVTSEESLESQSMWSIMQANRQGGEGKGKL